MNAAKFEELLTRGVDEVIDKKNLLKRLASGEKLRLKFGIDPTSADIHLGHAVAFRKLREFQDLGHHLILIIGDATAQVGDPTGKNKTRPILTKAEVKEYAKTYLDQVGKIVDLKKAEVRYNSEWFDKVSFTDVIQLMGKFTVAQMIERDDFSKRLTDGVDVHAHELIYPMMQAYDSVMIKADLEFGGTDQRFNILAGRDLQKKMDQKPQDMLVVPLLVGTDGVKKMSKSLGNYIAINEAPNEMYGKVMSIPDDLIIPYFELATTVPQAAIDALTTELASILTNPRDLKMQLAREIVTLYHGLTKAADAEAQFVAQFQKGELPEDIQEKKMDKSYKTAILALMDTGLVSSNAEARRLIEQGGVRIDGKAIDDPLASLKLQQGNIIQVGKRRFVKVK
jgi:tyrosyl-tRNA synthetase